MPPMFASNVLEASPPNCSLDYVSDLARDLFGLRGTCERLSGERDLNLLLDCDDGRRFLVKISNPAEDIQITDFQTKALRHVEKTAPDLPIPRVVSSLDGGLLTPIRLPDGRESVMRVLSFLAGEALHTLTPSKELRANLGRCLATLDISLSTFEHKAQDHNLDWNSATLLNLAPLIACVHGTQKYLVQSVLDRFADCVSPRLASLRSQVIYNDLNAYNVLVGKTDRSKITGIIDFGDIVRAPLVNDAAVAASYQFNTSGDGFGTVETFLRGYTEVLPLRRDEAKLVPDLIAARLATTVLITSWRAEKHPENRTYILRNNPSALSALELMRSRSAQELADWALRICRLETEQ